MSKTRIAINGFGRIGRMVFRQAILDENIDVVAINASYPEETLAHLIKYDSVHGIFECDINILEDGFEINGQKILHVNSREPERLPWLENDIDIVIEATGKFNSKEGASRHLQAGAKKVIITAPGTNVDNTIVLGVNEDTYDPETDHVVSNASCTTNCLAPVVKVLDENYSIINGLMTTVHAYTSDQQSLDNPHKDLRRARACGQSIIPTSTGAAKALGEVLPHLNGKLHGMALRVPTPNVSLVDLVVDVEKEVTVEEVNNVFKEAANGKMSGIVQYSDEPLVSIDYATTDYSAIIDGLSTIVMEDKKIKILAWYDNEWGYSARVVDLAKFVGKSIEQIELKNKVKIS
ncbi:glyceraldehyde-3-phosphate dehydrogenase [Pseudogracilibacillus auburnensis]|uniref:Glyceraldehyde-3-phosphate dehydrogenase n=1 Tax=Pseudogracilibacillus auburnensis TaxID=1494959 RepID=A0A2V3VTP6_9BACI|nr:glyceraldehyde-3-phosphate dehydrogenase [Pseudogracilibacillus auburnensis]MBO1004510.1 glyceraldehyde-3-phosphate dehydrogenase [Pseudogracilibacillus auburnensis]PXW85282.1 glyceraldehyde-3-phosphate dehydrogenase (NAD+) [Pseudogracilibacillus auburnensis]